MMLRALKSNLINVLAINKNPACIVSIGPKNSKDINI